MIDEFSPPELPLQEVLENISNATLYCPLDKQDKIVKEHNGLVSFIPSDSYGNLQEKLKTHPIELDLYSKHPLTYTINKKGFRTHIKNYDYLVDEEVDIILGCSYTFGIGFHSVHTWPLLLKRLMNENREVHQINLAIPGTGIDTAFRLLMTNIKKFKKIRRILHLQPYYSRVEYIIDSKAYGFLSSELETNKEIANFYTRRARRDILSNPTQHAISHIKGVAACKGLAEVNQIPYYYCNSGITSYKENPYEVFARDIGHGGLTGQYRVAKYFFDKVNNNDTSIDFTVWGDNLINNSEDPIDCTYIDEKIFPEQEFIKFVTSEPELSKFYPNAHYDKLQKI